MFSPSYLYSAAVSADVTQNTSTAASRPRWLQIIQKFSLGMKRYFSIIFFLFVLISFCHNELFSQNSWDLAKQVKAFPLANTRATIKGFTYEKTIYANKDSLNKGFVVEIEDALFKMHFFILTYDCEDCDIWEKVIYSKAVTLENAPILKRLKKGDMLSLGFFKLEKNKTLYTIRETVIIVTD